MILSGQVVGHVYTDDNIHVVLGCHVDQFYNPTLFVLTCDGTDQLDDRNIIPQDALTAPEEF